MKTRAALNPLVRDASRRDIDRIVGIEDASYHEPWARERFAGHLGCSGIHLVVADIGTAFKPAVCGYAAYFVRPDKIVLTRLAVAVAVRRRGVGVSLLARIVGRLTPTMREAVFVVGDRYTPAHHFLSALGWAAERGLAVDPDCRNHDAYTFKYHRDFKS